ncbi:unnamed protein product [Closterium sp. Naga37s-1]|nr:unnamed protein product [Closterium sp. Naga37s-1]
MNLMSGAINALFGFQPFFRFAAGKAREMMVKRGDAIGFPWAPRLAELKRHDWDEELRLVAATSRVPRDASGEYVYPEYYTKPFHAYEKGNLSLYAALEVELAAKAVHAPVFDPESKTLDPEGDANLRRGYHAKLVEQLRIQPKSIVDLGCASGLSTFALAEVSLDPRIVFRVALLSNIRLVHSVRDPLAFVHSGMLTFPEAEFIGVDLSPYFVAASNYNVREKSKQAGRELPFTFIHAAAEDTGLPAGSADLVSICLVCHDSEIIEEAHRILRPGGAFAVMEMNPRSPFFQRISNNPFTFAAFKATEPYLDDYRTFPIEDAIAERGFEYPQQMESSPRHRCIVAHKL